MTPKALLCGGPANGALVDDNRVLPPGARDVLLVKFSPPRWWESGTGIARYRRAEHGQYVFDGWEGE
jgi:hypothetical protein